MDEHVFLVFSIIQWLKKALVPRLNIPFITCRLTGNADQGPVHIAKENKPQVDHKIQLFLWQFLPSSEKVVWVCQEILIFLFKNKQTHSKIITAVWNLELQSVLKYGNISTFFVV